MADDFSSQGETSLPQKNYKKYYLVHYVLVLLTVVFRGIQTIAL